MQLSSSSAASILLGSIQTAARRGRAGILRGCVGLALPLVVLALQPGVVLSHETDQYTLPIGREFADLGPHLTRMVHGAIANAVDETNAAIKRSLRPHPPFRDNRQADQTTALQSADYIAGKVWLHLLAAFPTNEWLDNALAGQRIRAQYPG